MSNIMILLSKLVYPCWVLLFHVYVEVQFFNPFEIVLLNDVGLLVNLSGDHYLKCCLGVDIGVEEVLNFDLPLFVSRKRCKNWFYLESSKYDPLGQLT